MKRNIKKLCAAAVCLALSLALPFLTGQLPQIGSMLSPMHIPVLLGGFICGWPYGLVIGFVAPLLRFALFGMPPIFPVGIAMSFELAAYGAAAGILYQLLPKKIPNVYVSLISAMLIGRIIWGTVMFLLSAVFGLNFTFTAFLSGAFINAVPGIICHIAIIPPLVIALKKAGFILNGESR
jgi:riboflavin transporter FmnP